MKDNNVIDFKSRREPDPVDFSYIDTPTLELLNAFTSLAVQKDYLSHACTSYNERASNDNQTFRDRWVVLVGLPNWVDGEKEIDDFTIPHVRVPFGLLKDLMDCASINLNIGIFYDSETEKNLIVHTDVEDVENIILSQSAFMDNYFAEWDIRKRSEYISDIIIDNHEHSYRELLATASLAFANSMASNTNGINELVLDTDDKKEISEHQSFIAQANTKEFYEWCSGYFDYWKDYIPEVSVYTDLLDTFIVQYPNSLDTDERLIIANQMKARTIYDEIQNI